MKSVAKDPFDQWVSIVLAVYESVISERGAIYCSTPITSGKRYLNWLQKVGLAFVPVDDLPSVLRTEHEHDVVSRNIAHAEDAVARLRSQCQEPVINPAALTSETVWPQAAWRRCWEQVIDRYAHTLVFLDDWEFSAGCAHEYTVGLSLGRRLLNEKGSALIPNDAISLLEEAARAVKALGGQPTHLIQTKREIEKCILGGSRGAQ